METNEYYGGLYPDPPEEIEKEEYIFDEDKYYDEMKLKKLENNDIGGEYDRNNNNN